MEDTSRSDRDLLYSTVVQDGARLEDLEVVLARVGNDSLNLGVASTLELDIQGGGSFAGGS